MKKVLVTLLVAGTLVSGATSSFAAATAKPSVKPVTTAGTTAKEGTAKHEMSENSTTQKSEAKTTKTTKTKPMKKAKPMATATTKATK
jgi:hypothetical protein